MVELGLVRLYFWEVAIVEVTRIFEVGVSEHDDTTAFVSHCQVLPWFIECHGREDVRLWDIGWIALTKAIYENPVEGLLGVYLGSLSLGMAIAFGLAHRHFGNACDVRVHLLTRSHLRLILCLFHWAWASSANSSITSDAFSWQILLQDYFWGVLLVYFHNVYCG